MIAAAAMAAVSLSVHAGPAAYLVGSLGESPYAQSSDQAGNTILPQFGGMLEFRTPWVTPVAKATLGWYKAGWMPEAFLGLGTGFDWSVLRPSLALGLGLQSARKRDFLGESDEYISDRETLLPFGAEARVEVFRTLIAGITTRFGGYPYWSMEIGYRLGGR